MTEDKDKILKNIAALEFRLEVIDKERESLEKKA